MDIKDTNYSHLAYDIWIANSRYFLLNINLLSNVFFGVCVVVVLTLRVKALQKQMGQLRDQSHNTQGSLKLVEGKTSAMSCSICQQQSPDLDNYCTLAEIIRISLALNCMPL